MLRQLFVASLFIATAFLFVPSQRCSAAEAATMKVADGKPPEEVSEAIRAALDEKSLTLSTGTQPFFEFWFRKQLPLAKAPAGGTLAIDTIPEGSVLGVVRVTGQRRDFRDEDIPPGVYIVRIGIQPEDGNHQGVAPTRTFALLIPAKTDTKLEPLTHKDVLKAASNTNAAKHPSNLNLQPVEDTNGNFPRLEERNDGNHKCVLLKLPAMLGDSGEKTTLTFALVYDGTGII
jgi:hypothetical protein